MGSTSHSHFSSAMLSKLPAKQENDFRNPWGKRSRIGVGEWTGSWSDGSKEWTTYWMDKLNHKFGDEGRFWMSYDDLLHNFESLDRTRLFRKEWTVVQRWTGIHVSWVTGFLNTQFLVKIKKRGLTVFVLSQVCPLRSPIAFLPFPSNLTVSCSSTPATSGVLQANMNLNCILSCREKMPLLASISSGRAGIPLVVVGLSVLKLILGLVSTRCCQRFWRPGTRPELLWKMLSRSGRKGSRKN